MSEILNNAEGDEPSQSYNSKRRIPANLKAILALVAFILISIVGLNYFNALPFAQNLPLFSSLPQKSQLQSVPKKIVVKLSSCKILEEKFCDKAVLIERKASDGSVVKMIGINLPSGTPIFSPVDSQVLKSELPASGVYKGKQALMGGAVVSDSSFPSVSFRGDLKFDSTSTQNAKKGDVIGYAGDAGINNFGYNVVILIGAASENAQNVEKFLKPMFPQAFEKPAKQVEP